MSYRPTYKHGDNAAICDRCGFKMKVSKLKKEWTGLEVCHSCWEPRHPQDFVHGVKDDPSVPVVRPEQKDIEIDSSLWIGLSTPVPSGNNDNSL